MKSSRENKKPTVSSAEDAETAEDGLEEITTTIGKRNAIYAHPLILLLISSVCNSAASARSLRPLR